MTTTPVTLTDLRSAVDDAARSVGVTGTISVHEEQYRETPFGSFLHTDVHIKSDQTGSCPVTITLFEDPSLAGSITVSFGGDYEELWNLSRIEVLATLTGLLEAVMRGNYVEWRKPSGRTDDRCGVLTGASGRILYDSRGRKSESDLRQEGFDRMEFARY